MADLHHRRGRLGRYSLVLPADDVAVGALAAVVDSSHLVVVGHAILGARVGVARHRHAAQQTVRPVLAGGAIHLVGGRAGHGVPRQHGLAAGGGMADLHHRCGGLGRHRFDLPADDVAVGAQPGIVDSLDAVVVRCARLCARVGVAGGRGGAQQAVPGALGSRTIDSVGRCALHRVPCQHGFPAGRGVADAHHRCGGSSGRSYSDASYFKAPLISGIIADEFDFHTRPRDGDSLSSQARSRVFADLLPGSIVDVQVVEPALHVCPFIERHLQGSGTGSRVDPCIAAIIGVVVRAFHLRWAGADVAVVRYSDLAGGRNTAAVHGRNRDDGGAFLVRSDQAICVHRSDGGVRTAPADAAVDRRAGVSCRRKLERLKRVHGAGGTVQADGRYRLLHDNGAAGALAAHHDLDRGRTEAHALDNAGVADGNYAGVAAFPAYRVGKVLRLNGQGQHRRGALVYGQPGGIQRDVGGTDLLIHKLDTVVVGVRLRIGTGHAVDGQFVQVAERGAANTGHASWNGN